MRHAVQVVRNHKSSSLHCLPVRSDDLKLQQSLLVQNKLQTWKPDLYVCMHKRQRDVKNDAVSAVERISGEWDQEECDRRLTEADAQCILAGARATAQNTASSRQDSMSLLPRMAHPGELQGMKLPRPHQSRTNLQSHAHYAKVFLQPISSF